MTDQEIKIGTQKIRIKKTKHGEYLAITDLAKLINENTIRLSIIG